MGKVMGALVAVMLVVCVANADMTFEVVDGKAKITNTLTNQPVSAMGQNGQAIRVPAKQNVVVTYDPISKEQAQMQVIQLTTQRATLVERNTAQLTNIDAQLKLMKDIVTAIPDSE